jgi:hypothetical protein
VTAAEGYDQGTWEHITPEPRKATGRKDGRSGRDVIDAAAFGRLAKMNFDGRPADVPFSNAMWREALKEDACVDARIRAAKNRQKKGE